MRVTLSCLALLACKSKSPPVPAEPAPATAEEARAFIEQVDADLRQVWFEEELAAWNHATDINDANEAVLAEKSAATMAYLSKTIPQASRFDGLALDDDTRRLIERFKLVAGLPAPSDPARRARLAEVSTKLSGMYGKGEWCPAEGGACQDLGELSAIIGDVARPPAERQQAWERWRTVAKPMAPLYAEFTALGNEGAAELGYADMGALWRSKYDMPPEDFAAEIDRLYAQVQPLYEQLHCHVRAELNEKYGDDVVPPGGKLPAHLLGNMWAQNWEQLYNELAPFPEEPSLDVTKTLKEDGWDAIRMTRSAESFFVSMGLDPLPDSFWTNSMLVDPGDRDVECHASAWDVGMRDDLRIKMCIEPDADNLYTLHHELGHNYYYHYYHQLPALYQSGAHDGFHEAIGDAVMLSITPGYLAEIGLLDEVSTTDEAVINKQFQNALGAIAFLPFGRMIDQWRWDVFSGDVTPDAYNAHWWKLRAEFQGIAPPSDRPDDAFDPGAKYHIPGNTPYMRYFLAQVLQYQFHAAMCESAGHDGPLHTCSVFGNEAAGDRLRAMLSMGASKPWPDALEAGAGTREMDASKLVAYYAPLMGWLEEQNADRTCGW
jgi:peptidyl-dipeptidase A